MAKRWPDEQEADTRRPGGVSGPNSAKLGTCTERCGVDPAGISVKVVAQYPGRDDRVPERATGVERRREARSEVSRGHSRCRQGPKGRTSRTEGRTIDHEAHW